MKKEYSLRFKKTLCFLSLFFVVFGNLLVWQIQTASSQTSLNMLKNSAVGAGYSATTNENSAAATVGSVINVFLSILGVVFLVLVVYAGFLWMTAGGEEEKIKQAQKYIKNGLFGLLIIMSSFAISKFVFTYFFAATKSP